MATITEPGWGVSATVSGITGELVEWHESEEGITAYAKDKTGAVFAHKTYDKKATATASLLITEGAAAPAPGTEVSYAGKKWIVMRAEIVQANEAFQKMTVTLERYENHPAGA